MRYTPDASGATFHLSAARGAYQPQHQANLVVIHFARRPQQVVWRGSNQDRPLADWTFDEPTQTLTVRFPQATEEAELVLRW